MTTHVAKEKGRDAAHPLHIGDDFLATFAKFTLRVPPAAAFRLFLLPAVAAQVGQEIRRETTPVLAG